MGRAYAPLREPVPIVETPLGVRLCRPSERVLEILPSAYIGPFVKEDGAVVIDQVGSRVA